jgi:dihydrofolate reductase
MSTVVVSATMSVDGFVADEQDGVDELFGWYGNGDVVMKTARDDMSFSLSPEDAAFLRDFLPGLGALLVGRRLFDITDGWGGLHPLGVPVVVLTHSVPEEWVARHPDAPFTFVTDGVERAVEVASEIAGEDRTVGVAAGNVGSQVIEAGLADRLVIDLAPVVLGRGRPFFDGLRRATPVRLGEPRIVQGAGVVHLVFDVQDHSAAQMRPRADGPGG